MTDVFFQSQTYGFQCLRCVFDVRSLSSINKNRPPCTNRESGRHETNHAQHNHTTMIRLLNQGGIFMSGKIRTRKRGSSYSYGFETTKNPRRIKEKGGFATEEAYQAGIKAYADWKNGNSSTPATSRHQKPKAAPAPSTPTAPSSATCAPCVRHRQQTK